MAIAKTIPSTKGDYLVYRCPGCKCNHSVPAARWNWNGSLEKPTLSPSVRHFFPAMPSGSPEQTICHYFVEDGNIRFCDDCQHELKSQTVPLPELVEGEDE